MEDLEGKVAVVTGGGSGIGEGIARAAAQAGMKVVVADVDEENWPRDILTIQGIAAQRGQLEVLKWARENGAPRCPFICEFACEGHQFEVLEWAVMNRVEDWEAHVRNYEEALFFLFGGASESEESEDSRSGV